MILVVSKNQGFSKRVEDIVRNIDEECVLLLPGFSFVNQFLELEVGDIDAIVFDDDSMKRTISLLESSGEIDLMKTINLIKIVDQLSDDYLFSAVNAIEVEESSLEEQLPILLQTFVG